MCVIFVLQTLMVRIIKVKPVTEDLEPVKKKLWLIRFMVVAE